MVTTTTMAFKTDVSLKDAIVLEAKKLGVTPSKLIVQKLSQTTPLSQITKDTLDHYAKVFRINVGAVADMLIIDWIAKRAAEEDVLGRTIYDTNPFVYDMHGRRLTGDDLYLFLKDAYKREILTDQDLMKRGRHYQRKRKEELSAKYEKK